MLVWCLWLIVSTGAVVPKTWSWDHIPLFADFFSPGGLTNAQATFMANHYQVISLEKDFARGTTTPSEEAIYTAARQIKQTNPTTTVIFYWNTAMDFSTYTAHSTFMSHPNWRLKDQHGKVIITHGEYEHDVRVPGLRKWWASVPVSGNQSDINNIDGVFCDAATRDRTRDLGVKGNAEYQSGMEMMLGETITTVQSATGREAYVIYNGMHSKEADGGLYLLPNATGLMVEHFAAFEMRNKTTGVIDPVQMQFILERIQHALKMKKIVVVKSWPGPVVSTPPNMWPSNTPNTTAAKAKAAGKLITFPLAAFLTVVDVGAYFSYSWWYSIEDGYMPCPSCSCPEGWYPEFGRKLGEPVGPAVQTGYRYTRKFAHASVFVDLENEKSATITWES